MLMRSSSAVAGLTRRNCSPAAALTSSLVPTTLSQHQTRSYTSSSHAATSHRWIQQYTQLPFPQRQLLLRDEVVPQLFPNNNSAASRSNEEDSDALFPPSVSNLYHELSRKKGAIKTSMMLRDDISAMLKPKDANPTVAVDKSQLKHLDKVLQNFLQQSLCCYDSMSLQRITFEDSSGLVLENVARGESVHRVRSLRELKRRLHDGKRCFALFHPAMKEDPLVFIHVALTTQLAGTLSSLEAHKEEVQPTHAMFYSVNSPHTALRGLDIASLLIKEVAAHLKGSFPSLQTFSTLSPMPKFMSWLAEKAAGKSGPQVTLPSVHLTAVETALSLYCKQAGVTFPDDASTLSRLVQMLSGPSLLWLQDEHINNLLQPPMLWLGSYYIATEKMATKGAIAPLPKDDVARFHLRNGAEFHQINWMGNVSQNGIQTSATMMVNYLYDLPKVEQRAAIFGTAGYQVAASTQIQALLAV